jgi:hypothetical protein
MELFNRLVRKILNQVLPDLGYEASHTIFL